MNMHLKIISVILLLILLSCEKESIKIGFIADLSGKNSTMGIEERNGLSMAVEDVNSNGGIHGRRIEVLYRDDGGDPQRSRVAVNELIDLGVEAIIGNMTSSMTLAIIDIVRERGVIMISPTTSTSELSGYDDIFYRVVEASTREAEHLGEFVVDDLGIESSLIVWDISNKAYTYGWGEALASNFENSSSNFIMFDSREENSFNIALEKILEMDTESVALAMGARDSARFIQELSKRDFKSTFLLCGWAKNQDLLNMGGKLINGVFFSEMFSIDSQDPDYVRFSGEFYRKFGYRTSFAGVHAYEAGDLLFNAMEDQKKDETLKEAIDRIDSFKGLQGIIEIDDYGDVIRGHTIITVKNGEYINYK